jgi:outer membrane murein-binding lipoprotein Lpp
MSSQIVNLPVTIAADDIKKALKGCIEEDLQELRRTSQRGIEALGDGVDQKRRELEANVDGLGAKIQQQVKDGEKAIDELKTKLTTRANAMLIPITLIVLAGGVAAIWAGLGTTYLGVRDKAGEATLAVNLLKADVAAKEADLRNLTSSLADLQKYNEKLGSLESRIQKLESDTNAPTAATPKDSTADKIRNLEAKVGTLNGQVNTLTKLVTAQAAASSAAANNPQPSKP